MESKNFLKGKKGYVFLILFILIMLEPAIDLQAAPEKKSKEKVPHRVPLLDTSFHIDGTLDEPGWQQALKMELKYEYRPGDNIKPPVRTEVFLAHSQTKLYVAFRAYDPQPSAIRARCTDRDKVTADDWVSISLDTFNDQRRIYTFVCNPLGMQADLVETADESNYSWDTIWSSSGRIVENGYIVEMAIPFRALRFQRKSGNLEQVWGFDVVRRYPRNLDHLIGIFPRDRSNSCYMCQMEKLTGFAGAKAGKNIEIDPSISAVLTQDKDTSEGGKWVEREKRLNPGITFQWGLSPNTMLNATINPDFSQVEADAAQLDVNTQFALYYPEKRPFFLEGGSIFSTPLSVIYTRAVADPDWGIKLTGKQGPHALGFYTAQDHITNLLLPGSQNSTNTSLSQKAIGTVLRYRFDLGKRASTLGLLVTDREGEDYYNRLAGFDVYWRFTKRKSLNLQLLGSQTRYPQQVSQGYAQPEEGFTGTALDFIFKHESRNIGYQFYYRDISPDFRADMGYMPHVGYRRFTALFIGASWKNPGHWYTFINAIPQVEYETDSDNNLIHKKFEITCNYMGPMQSWCQLIGSFGEQSYMGETFNINQGAAVVQVQPSGSLTLQFTTIFGNEIDLDNIRQGSHITLNPHIVYKAGRHLSLTLDHVMQRFEVENKRLYTANVSNLTAVYQFNRRSFLRTILQYVDYDYNVSHYIFPTIPKYKHLFTQILFSYKVNPQTVLFLGYSDDSYGYLHMPVSRTNRTFFLKIGYALIL